MNSPGLVPGRLGHSLGRPACGRRQHDIQSHPRIVIDDGVDGRRLTGAGSACYYDYSVGYTLDHRFKLQLVQLYIPGFLHLKDSLLVLLSLAVRNLLGHTEAIQHGCTSLLLIVIEC